MRRLTSTLTVVLTLGVMSPTILAGQGDPLVRAHDLYNRQEYEQAIRAAVEAQRVPAQADAAAVVLGRAYLELYRRDADANDLEAARRILTPLQTAAFSARNRLDWTIAMGELLYFDRRFSTSAEFFDVALAHVDLLEAGARESLIEWWASALDQEAQLGPAPERQPVYLRILARCEDELRRDDRSLVASYWLAAAAVGAGDLDRAWAAAEAGWLRAASAGKAGTKLRADFDQLVATVIIPERVRHLATGGDPRPAMTLMQQNWDEMKKKYGR
jgi:hypothetical protein